MRKSLDILFKIIQQEMIYMLKLPYIEYIINFVVQTFLYKKNEKTFMTKIYGTSTIADIKKQLNIKQKKSLISMFHNIVIFIYWIF